MGGCQTIIFSNREDDITKIEIPTVFHKAIEVIEQKLNSEHYDAVVAIGQAGGLAEITPERIGINIDDARIADNDGNQPIDIPIRKWSCLLLKFTC